MSGDEHSEQVAVINWCYYMLAQYPELDLIHAIANGAMLGGGRIVLYLAIGNYKNRHGG
jgi:hypothetical protein